MTARWLRRRFPRLQRFWQSQRGATALEFAMVAAPFAYLILAILETAIMLFSEYVIEHGVSNAARMIRTGQVQTQALSAAEFKTLVCGGLASYLDCSEKLHVDVRAFATFDDVSLPAPITAEGEVSDSMKPGAFQPGEPLEAVVVRVYYEWDLVVPGITYLSNMTGGRRLLASGAAFRNEPFTN